MTGESLKQTPLHRVHVDAGARLVPFGGWDMPVQYAGIIEEHRAVRTRAGLFDVSHMGEAEVTGSGAVAFVQRLVTNDLGRIAVGQAMYTPLCTPEGGIIDDLLVYRLGEARLMLVVNAANTDADLAWLRSHLGSGAALADISAETALLALQGPRAPAILARLTREPVDLIKYYWFRDGVEVAGRRAIVSRTGYTGEDGFELYIAAEDAPHLWGALLEAGKADGVVPAGLGARDTLRLEAGLLLHGNDMDRTTTPLEVGLGWTVKLQKGDFIGADVLRRQKAEGTARRLAGFVVDDRAIARHGFPILLDGRHAGHVTSGTFGPTVQKNIGLGFVPPAHASPGTRIAVEIRGRPVPATVVKTPFYTRPKAGAA
ncbi:MAG TPA: glycine cleavage system aminomethyltransferase GcvT [bacterium]|nr:glycine cleavage system aminomethyltransferase GcvT [bacterium]